jgi:valyl-tRNA synthetase
VPLAGAIDFDAERERLRKEIDRSRKDRDKLARKVSNPDFLAKAPPEIVAKDRERLADLDVVVGKLEESLKRIGG